MDSNFDPSAGVGGWMISVGNMGTKIEIRDDAHPTQPGLTFSPETCFGVDAPVGLGWENNLDYCVSARTLPNGQYGFTVLVRYQGDSPSGRNGYPSTGFRTNSDFDTRVPIYISASDANGNESEPAIFEVNVDTSPPGPAHGLYLTVLGATTATNDDGTIRAWHTNDENITIQVHPNTPIKDSPNRGNFGCTYLHTSQTRPNSASIEDWLNISNLDQCLHWDAGGLPVDCADSWLLNTTECYGAGSVAVSVVPEEGSTLYCLRGVDRAGQMSAANCVVIVQDRQAPVNFDAYPTNVEVRGRRFKFRVFPASTIRHSPMVWIKTFHILRFGRISLVQFLDVRRWSQAPMTKFECL